MTQWMYLIGFSVSSALALAALPARGDGLQHCGPRQAIIDRLSDRFGETRQSVGLAGNNTVVETFASAETGTWTIIVTRPNGLTCLVASGQSFEALAVTAPSGEKA